LGEIAIRRAGRLASLARKRPRVARAIAAARADGPFCSAQFHGKMISKRAWRSRADERASAEIHINSIGLD
jgi:hypothetical protein